jgi:hypothetical protein
MNQRGRPSNTSNWAAREAERLGTTPHALLTKIVDECGHKCSAIAATMGMSIPAAIAMLRKYGVHKRNSREFDYRGHRDSFAGHCRRLNISHPNACSYMHKHKLTMIEALDQYLAGIKSGKFGVIKRGGQNAKAKA